MDFIEKLNNIYETHSNIEIYLDMDGTLVELLFDKNESYTKKGVYLNKKPITPSEKEIRVNSRSKSAKLRIVERI